jgi:hypothetical protein
MAKTPEQMLETMIANLPEQTGKTLDQWIAVVRKSGLEKHGQIVTMLKGDHGITHGYANLIAHSALKSDAASVAAEGTDLVDAQYSGEKAGLRAIHDRIMDAVDGFGDDVEVAPKKAYVSLRRKKQFALVQPTTKTRVDVGLTLTGVEPAGRLEASGSFNAMCSHRVRIGAADEVDAALIAWLRQAYDTAG